MTLALNVRPDLLTKTVVSPSLPTSAREQYRKLAGVLHNAQLNGGLKTVIICSAVASEGKTLTAANLALTLSQSFQRRVLLIDADLRRPSLHNLFQIRQSPGLSEALQPGVAPLAVPTALTDMFSVLPAGHASDPVKSLSSDTLGPVLAATGAAYDWVLVDTPPVGVVSDARLIAAHADGVLFVVGAGGAPKGLIQNAVETIGRDRVLGIVLNRADELAVTGGYYYNYSSYSQYRPTPETVGPLRIDGAKLVAPGSIRAVVGPW